MAGPVGDETNRVKEPNEKHKYEMGTVQQKIHWTRGEYAIRWNAHRDARKQANKELQK